MTDKIPIVETYRGVGIHDAQPVERIERVVKPAIDAVLKMGDVDELIAFAGDISNAPEARILAGAKLEAMFELAIAERRERPDIDLLYVRALTAGVDSVRWRDRKFYCCLADVSPPRPPRAARREVPLPD